MITSSLPARVVRTIRERDLLKPGDSVIVALSGGADSCALLDLLANLPGFPLKLIAAHLNHCLRGSESDDDEVFCRTLAERYDIPFESRRVDIAARAARQRQNLEECGRQARITFFAELRNLHLASHVALGHHANDQAETLLMRLLRGSGTTGLAGMPFSNDFCHIRPLLNISRSEIINYLNERNLVWREDVSNQDTAFLRNRIRHELLPHLELYNPAIMERLAVTSGLMHEDNVFLESLTADEFENLVHRESDSVVFDVVALKRIPPALLKRIIRRAISEIAGTLRNQTNCHISVVSALLSDGPPNRCIHLPENVVVRREYGCLRFFRDRSTTDIPTPVYVHGPGRHNLWDGMILDVCLSSRPNHLDETSKDTGYFDLNKAPFPWFVRTFNPGDRMNPLGMTGSKKVKCIFIDQKIPSARRQRIPLIYSNGVLIWVYGLRFSARAALSNDTALVAKAVLAPE